MKIKMKAVVPALSALLWLGAASWARAGDFGKSGVLILGYNCNEPNWEETVWGSPPGRPGRLVRGAAELLARGAKLAIISGGAQCKDGRNEAQWMKGLLYERLAELKRFTVYPVLSGVGTQELRERLDWSLVLEEKAKNTVENIANTGRLFSDARVSEVVIVTSPDHISRGMRDALAAWGKDYPDLAASLYGAPSVTLYSARTPEDAETARMSNVVVAEPPAMKKLDLGRLLKLLGNEAAVEELNAVLERHSPKAAGKP